MATITTLGRRHCHSMYWLSPPPPDASSDCDMARHEVDINDNFPRQ